MGPVDTKLARDARGTVSVMLLGLQGVGKTTVAAKLARHLAAPGTQAAAGRGRRLPPRRGAPAPAARRPHRRRRARRRRGRQRARDLRRPPPSAPASEGFDAIVYDTAGRLAIDDELMQELAEIRTRVAPANTLLVCDALMGRDAVNVAQAFSERLTLDGLILTKLDGDARGGAALAVKAVTGVPIKFLGTGEAVDRLETFRPEGLASRILGMGDIVGLVEDFEQVVDEREAEEPSRTPSACCAAASAWTTC